MLGHFLSQACKPFDLGSGRAKASSQVRGGLGTGRNTEKRQKKHGVKMEKCRVQSAKKSRTKAGRRGRESGRSSQKSKKESEGGGAGIDMDQQMHLIFFGAWSRPSKELNKKTQASTRFLCASSRIRHGIAPRSTKKGGLPCNLRPTSIARLSSSLFLLQFHVVGSNGGKKAHSKPIAASFLVPSPRLVTPLTLE